MQNIRSYYASFKGYEKAFYSVETSAVMKAFRRQRIEETYGKILEDIYKESTATVKSKGGRGNAPLGLCSQLLIIR